MTTCGMTVVGSSSTAGASLPRWATRSSLAFDEVGAGAPRPTPWMSVFIEARWSIAMTSIRPLLGSQICWYARNCAVVSAIDALLTQRGRRRCPTTDAVGQAPQRATVPPVPGATASGWRSRPAVPPDIVDAGRPHSWQRIADRVLQVHPEVQGAPGARGEGRQAHRPERHGHTGPAHVAGQLHALCQGEVEEAPRVTRERMDEPRRIRLDAEARPLCGRASAKAAGDGG